MPDRSNNTANPNDNYKFTAYEFDDEGGLQLYYAGARMYDPVIGRFMSIDRFYHMYPSMNPYQYAANNPINFIDINGDSVYQITTSVGRVGGNHHTYLLLAPDDLEAFSESGYADLLQEYTFTNEQGEEVTKLGVIVRAGPETNNVFDLGSLTASTNEEDHPSEGQTSTYLINSGDQSDNEFITNILGNHSNYTDRILQA